MGRSQSQNPPQLHYSTIGQLPVKLDNPSKAPAAEPVTSKVNSITLKVNSRSCNFESTSCRVCFPPFFWFWWVCNTLEEGTHSHRIAVLEVSDTVFLSHFYFISFTWNDNRNIQRQFPSLGMTIGISRGNFLHLE